MAYRRSLDFLPTVFRTEVNDKFLHATIDQLISEPELRRLDGYVGRRFSPVAGPTDSFISEINDYRQNYQLEPHSVYLSKDDKVKFSAGYIDLLRRVESLGGFTDNHSRLFDDETYNYDGFIDFDKFLNYSSYYWLPDGPDPVTVFATEIPLQQDYVVTPPVLYQVVNGEYEKEKFDVLAFDVSENAVSRVRDDGIKFNVTGTKINPTIRLARGGVYKFVLDQIGHGFFIQTYPGTTDQLSWQNNLSSRDVFGVENNGEDVGIITFKVPEVTAQDFFKKMTVFASASLAAHSTVRNRDLRYNEIQYKKYDEIISKFGGIDGQRMLEGKTVVFPRDPATGKNPQPWAEFTNYLEGDLLQYGNNVWRALADFTSGREFNTAKLEIYDLQRSWNNPDLFDSIDRPFDGANFDIGPEVSLEQRKGIFNVSINAEGFVVLTPGTVIPRNNKVKILEGTTYGNKELYRDSSDDIILVPPTTADLDKLYYADSLDPNIGGVIEIVDQNNNLNVDVVGSILGKTSYESPNGVKFTNGLKVKFLSDVKQAEYANRFYYVEGVGKSIKLINTEDLIANEPWLDTIESPYDITSFDSEKFSASSNTPTKLDYFVINRSSLEKSAWARHNRWFHKDVVELTNKYNKFTTMLTADQRAKRPILEFDANLQLYNFGQVAKKPVDVIDFNTIDALSNVEGQPVLINDENVVYFTGTQSAVNVFKAEKLIEGYTVVSETVSDDGVVTIQMKIDGIGSYFVDDIPLFPGMRVIFTADRDPEVRNKIYEVQWIRPQSESDDRVWTFISDGSTISYDLNYDVAEPSRLQVFVNGANASSQGYYWSYLAENQGLTFSASIPPQDSIITISLEFDEQIHLVPAEDSEVIEGDCVYVKQGISNQGNMFYFDGETWIKAQQKTKINQAPTFDLYDRSLVSFGNQTHYPSNDFNGNKLFGYEIGTGNTDPILGIKLKYRNINNIGDILFSDFITKGHFNYREGEQSLYKSTLGGKVRINDENRNFSFRNQWTKIRQKSRQLQLQTYYATEYQKNLFRLNVMPDGAKSTMFTNIVVYVNNTFIFTNKYDLQIEDNIAYLMFDNDLTPGDKVDIKVYSSQVNANSVFSVPLNFTNNPFNKEVNEITLGQMRNHIIKCVEDVPNLSSEPLSEFNLRDTQDVKTFRGEILQHAGSTHLANLFLNDESINFINSVTHAQREYVRFKNRFTQLINQLAVPNELPAQTLERVMLEMTANKNKNFPFFTSDMLAFGNDYAKKTFVVYDTRLATYDITEIFNTNTTSEKAISVYLNNKLLLIGRDYSFSSSRAILELDLTNVTLREDDVLEIREYNSTDGSYIPATPTKLGLYPKFVPSIVSDGYGENTRQMLRGHDGSLTAIYNDFRDDVLLELETRIYNNLKVDYNVNRFDIYNYIPGAFRKTDYNLEEFNSILSSHFSAWSGVNAVAVSDYRQFDANDSFTFNYGRFTNRIDGKLMPASYWRGLYNYYFDTDAPHLRPWEMLGFKDKPYWWEISYGPAPYTRGNSVLWNDIEAGKILFGNRAGIDLRFARPGLSTILPVDDSGELLSPFECLSKDINELDVSGFYKFGDGGPIETVWKQSSEYPFVLQIALSLMKPAEYFGKNIDTNKQVIALIDNQEIFSDTGLRDASNLYVQNELDSNNNVVRVNSYITWISEFCKSRGLNITNALGNKVRGLESRLGYKLAGYSDKKYLKIITDQYTPASNNPGVIIPDDDYDIVLNKSAPSINITYSGVIVTKTVDGYSVTGYDDNKPYFMIESSVINENKSYIKVGKLSVIKYNQGSGENYRVPYGTEFFSIDQLADFLISYGRYLTNKGFQFTDKIDEDASWYQDWDLSVREFLFYVQQGWDVDVAISLSPVGSKINYKCPFGTVDALSNRPLNTRILDEDFKIVQFSDYTVYRNGRDFNAKIDSKRGIYLLDINVVEYEHVLIFNNKTRFNDIIYDPILGDRQHRLRLQGFKTNDWDGTYGAAGFIINDDNVDEWRPGVNYNKGDIVIFKSEYFTALEKIPASETFEFDNWIKTEYASIKKGLLPNLANRAGLAKTYYNTNEVNLEEDSQKLAKNLIGFEPRDYMSDLGISDTSQFKFYQGMISQKGTNSSLNKLLKAKLDNFGGSANVYEEWAIRLGTYGATDSTRNLQIELDESWAIKDPLVIELLNDNDVMPNGHKGLRSKDILVKHMPYDKNFLPLRNSRFNINDLYSAGYAQLSDVDYTAPTRDALNNYIINDNVGAGDLVWIAADRNNQWNIYRIDETDVKLETANIISNGNATIRCVNNHNLQKNDLIYIVSDVTNPNVFGFFTVINIVDARTFVVSTGYGTVQINPFSGFLYKLKSVRFDSVSQVLETEPLKGWQKGDRLFIDNASDNGYAVYENQKIYQVGPYYKTNRSLAQDKLGTAIATDIENYYMIAGRPGSNNNKGDLVLYTITGSGTLQEIANLSTNSVGVEELGSSVSASNDATFVAGAPKSDDIGFVTVVSPDAKSSEFITQQVLTAESTDLLGEFGFSLALSNDGDWLAVGQPGIDEGYVHIYQRNFVSLKPSVTVRFDGDGSTSVFELTGDAANPNDTASVIVEQDGIYLEPTTDYNVSGSNLILTAAPGYGSKLFVTVNRGAPTQEFITDGSTASFTLTGDNATPVSIYALFVVLNGVIQVPFRDYTLALVGAEYVLTFTTTPDANQELKIIQKTNYRLVTSFTAANAVLGDRFGHALAFTSNAKQLLVGAPNTSYLNEDSALVENSGAVYIFDRTIETYYANGIDVDYNTETNIEGITAVYLDGIRLVASEDYTAFVSMIRFNKPPAAGTLIKIETNNFILTSELNLSITNQSNEESARFGESVTICPTNCSVYVGAPGCDTDKVNAGKVFRFINQGRYFGYISGTVENPTISEASALIINDFIIVLDSVYDLDDVIVAINEKNIPGVTAYNDNGYLYIETNSTITGDKLIITTGQGQPLIDLGLEIYPYQQTINSPDDDHYVEFGRTVAMGPDATMLAVGSSRAASRLETTIDNKTTYFDARATSFNDIKKQSGAVWLYQYIPTAYESVTNPGQFIAGQRLINTMIDQLDEYGTSIAINRTHIYVGAPGDDTVVQNGGIVFSFNNLKQEKIWKVIKEEEYKVDINLINRVFLYNKETNSIVTDLDFIDPIKGKISGLAAQEITYQTPYDPAVYSNTKIGKLWTNDHVGQVWWDISQTRWLNYEQDSITNRGVNWNTAFPGSTIICYEWTESDLPPSQFEDKKDTTAFPRSNSYNVVSEIDPNTGIVTNKYYYWVAGKRSIPAVKNRRYSTVDIENLIANPRSTGIPFISFIAPNAVALYNCAGLLQDKNVVLNIEYDAKLNENSIHSEYQLIAQDDANSIPNNQLIQKVIDSLAGTDLSGNLVPDIHLSVVEKYGIEYRPRQTMFRDRKLALKSAVDYMNLILATIPAREVKNTTNLLASEDIPNVYSDAWDEIVNNKTELSYLNISLFPDNFRILVRVDDEAGNRWTIYKKKDNAWTLDRVQAFDNTKYIELADWIKPGNDDPIVTNYTVDFNYQLQSLRPLVGQTVKVKDAGNGRYNILRYNSDNKFEIIKQQSSTYKIKETIYNETTQGYDQDTFDIQGYDYYSSIETQKILRAIYDDIFDGDEQIEKNRWFLLMIQYVLSEQKYVDYAFKTSFIKVEHRDQQAISQIPNLQKDRQDNLRQYIEEIKPYHTKIREFVNSHEGIDPYKGDVTDFDLPAYYNETSNKYRSPTGLDEIDDIIFERPEYQSWLNNHTLEIDSVIVYNSGQDYLEAPELTVEGTTGFGAKLQAVVINGEITKVEVLNPGQDFITTPTIKIGNSGGSGAVLIPIMKNSKIRSIKDVIKFDRIPNNGGFLIQFLDSAGDPVDIRSQRKSRLLGDEGVIDELIDALTMDENLNTHWIKESSGLINWPVENAVNYRIFNDDSGRIQIQYKKRPGGWTAALLQTYLQNLGTAVGVDELDISETTVVVDGNMSIYSPTVLEWMPNTRYDQGDVIIYKDKPYVLRESVNTTTTNDEFELDDFRIYTPEEFESHLNRTWTYYKPKAGSLGKDLSQLFAGIEYPGVKVQGPSFRAEPGFDIGNYDMASFDQYILGPEGVTVLDESILDQTLYSNFLDTSLGTRPGDLITAGGSFVDTYSSHAPEEAIPGRVYDTLNITVHTLSTNFYDSNAGFSPDFNVNKYQSNSTRLRYKFRTGDQIHLGDYFIVYSSVYGPLYRDLTQTNFVGPATIVPGGYYDVAQQRSYTVDWANEEIVFKNPLPAGDLLTILNIGQIGENVIADDHYQADGTTAAFRFNVSAAELGGVLVLVNGIPDINFSTQNINGQPHVIFLTTPPAGSHIHMIATLNTDYAISYVNTQYAQVSDTNRSIILNRQIRQDRSKDTVMLVELNGRRLRPGNSVYYTGDGSTVAYSLPISADDDYNANINKIEAWINGYKIDTSKYSITPYDGSSAPQIIFTVAPNEGSDISLTYSGEAEFTFNETTKAVTILETVAVPAGSMLAVTAFSHHDAYKFKTKVFKGIDYSTNSLTVSLGYSLDSFDDNGFDATLTVTKPIGVSYTIDSDQNSAEKVFISINGQVLMASQDYLIENGVISISNNILIEDDTIIVVTWMSANTYTNSTTFRVFKDLNDNYSYNRVAFSEATTLAKDLKITDEEIHVTIGSRLGTPNPEKNFPGVIFIGGERITYWQKTGNVLSQIRRGTGGTAASLLYAKGSVVVDAGGKSTVPSGSLGTWYDLGDDSPTDGRGLQLSNTIQAKFLKQSKGILPFLSAIEIGGYILPGYVLDQYFS
jgi:hypothetical protein